MSTSLAGEIVLALKRQALQHKKAGDIDAAKTCLGQAKALEALDDDNKNANDWKQLALLLKKHGNLAGAKQALARAKQLQQQPSAAAQQPPKQQQHYEEDPVNRAMDEATLDELDSTTKKAVTYTTEEMLDVETMVDLKQSGLEIPTQTDYETTILGVKREALAAKQGGHVDAAKRHLLTAKQLTVAMETIFSSGVQGGGDEDDKEDYSLLDELMDNGDSNNKQQQQHDDGFLEELFGASATRLELEDLDDLDAEMLQHMQQAGMEIPTVPDLEALVKEKKEAAVAFHKQGNAIAAAAALDESKRLQGRAQHLASMLEAIEKGLVGEGAVENMDPEAALEAMLRASEEQESKPSSTKGTQKTLEKVAAASSDATPPSSASSSGATANLKSAEDYKAQALQFKKEGKTQEALTALKLYKRVLAMQAHAQTAEQRQECFAMLQNEYKNVVQEQLKLFKFYERFIHAEMGQTQLDAWTRYGQQCQAAMVQLKQGGSSLVLERTSTSNSIGNPLQAIREKDLTFISKTCHPNEDHIEVSILEIVELERNKNLRKAFEVEKGKDVQLPAANAIRVLASVQLPPSAEAPDDIVQLEYAPARRDESVYSFDCPAQMVNAERGTTRFAKLVARRLSRKRILFDVFYQARTGSFFSKTVTETLLGTAVVELKELLQGTVIASDFPLMDAPRRHQVGGYVRLAIRTGSPFGDEAQQKKTGPALATTGLVTPEVDMAEYSPLALGD